MTRDNIMFKRSEKKKAVKYKYLFTLGTKDTGGDCVPAIKNLKEANDGQNRRDEFNHLFSNFNLKSLDLNYENDTDLDRH